MGEAWLPCKKHQAARPSGASGKNGKAPVQETDVQMDSVETRMGKKTVELHHISKSYGDKVILDDFDYIVLRNQRFWNYRTKWMRKIYFDPYY